MTGTPDCSFTRNFQVSGIERSQGWILVVMQRLQSGLIAFAFLIAFSFSKVAPVVKTILWPQ
jgi:hypothetical protein